MNIKLAAFLLITSVGFAQTATYPLEDSGKYETYITRDGKSITVGDEIEIGMPYATTQFVYITQGNEPIAARLAGNFVKITKLMSYGKDKTGYKMYALFKGYGLIAVFIDIEMALKTGEIIIE